MQLRLNFSIPNKLVLPLSYHHIIQGFIYNILRANPEYSFFLHDNGYKDGGKPFKLFVFSLLEGKYITDKKAKTITFHNKVSFELRSPMDYFCDFFCLSIMHQDNYVLNGQELFLDGCVYTKRTITEEAITVRTLSPICLTKSDTASNGMKTLPISPRDENFSEAANKNFISKYRAAHDSPPTDNIQISPVSISRYVTQFVKSDNNIYITAWNGKYKITGRPEYLSFLYDCGIGSKNSQGFGMVEKVREADS